MPLQTDAPPGAPVADEYELMISVAGIRGIVGTALTPPVVTNFVAAFASSLEAGPVVVGRDARPSGAMMLHAVSAGLIAAGRDVVDLGLATTPTTQLAVEHLRAAGGIIITASHNPAAWNALKFLSPLGEFLDADAGRVVRERYASGRVGWRPAQALGHERAESGALAWHLERVLGLDVIDVPRIRARKLTVVVDGCASAGGLAVPALLDRLGARTIELDCEPNGAFTRELEPLAEHLGVLRAAVVAHGADLGVAVDPDADRAAFVDGHGVPLGEEYTVALGTMAVLDRKRGPVVTNLSTSRILDAVCERYGIALGRSPVGEAHVVAEMKRRGAIAGGEGNGGMILPAAHYGRDSLVAVALVAELMAARGRDLRSLADELPRTSMLKEKLDRPDTPWDRLAARLHETFREFHVESSDGLRFSRAEEWVHVRPSGTEPVVRVIAESPSEPGTRDLIERARQALAAAA